MIHNLAIKVFPHLEQITAVNKLYESPDHLLFCSHLIMRKNTEYNFCLLNLNVYMYIYLYFYHSLLDHIYIVKCVSIVLLVVDSSGISCLLVNSAIHDSEHISYTSFVISVCVCVCVHTVSYTHLDVYKRQDVRCRGAEELCCSTNLSLSRTTYATSGPFECSCTQVRT